MKTHLDENRHSVPHGLRSVAACPADGYLERQAARESNARSYPRRLPIALKKAGGIYVEDTDGHTYIDCLAGAGALALGHNHPVVLEAIRGMLADGVPMQTLDLTTPVKDRFVETLFASLP
ncbi:MAG: aminotransferase class III-fold pyridoxal phosphate-dependent enzyme, partial [Acidimicrobiia bacterium]